MKRRTDHIDPVESDPERTDRLPNRIGEGVDSDLAEPPNPLRGLSIDQLTQRLRGPEGDAILDQLEREKSSEFLDLLAAVILGAPDLSVERIWRSIELLENAGLVDANPDLRLLREELVESFDSEDASLEALIEQIEEDPTELWIALEGLASIEPQVRLEIVAELGLHHEPLGPGTAELLRLLAFAHDRDLQRTALQVLSGEGGADGLASRSFDPHRHQAWETIARSHPDPLVVSEAFRWLGSDLERLRGIEAPIHRNVSMEESVVTGVDGSGRARIGWIVGDLTNHRRTVVLIDADVAEGIHQVQGQHLPLHDRASAVSLLEPLRAQVDLDIADGNHEFALLMVAGLVTISGPATTPALQYWLEASINAIIPPRSGDQDHDEVESGALPLSSITEDAVEVLDCCPTWLDDSDLTYELAEELRLRWGSSEPDPERDAGLYRVLFDRRVRGELERYCRMLIWMGRLWRAVGSLDLAGSALRLAAQLADPQHDVPAHPFVSLLSTRSLRLAIDQLNQGVDLRDPTIRAAIESGLGGAQRS